MNHIPDYVYYIKVNDKIILEQVFSTQHEAELYAISAGYTKYEIIEWDVQ